MKISARSVLMAGVATLTTTAVAIAPSVQPAPPPKPAFQLAAAVQPLVQPVAPSNLSGWVQRIVVPPSAGAPFPTPQFPPVVGGTSIDATIKNIYNAIEPWVQWGFEVAAYAVGWIPYVGWLAPQITIFYTFGEQIVRSITFNIADWLGGNVSFGQGLVNVGVDTVNAFIYLANAELAFWLPPLPPIPPLPSICLFCNTLSATTLVDPSAAPVQVPNAGGPILALLNGVFNNPLNAGGGVDGAFGGIGSLGSLFRNGFADIGDLLGVQLSPPELQKTSEVSTVPSIVKNTLNGLDPAADATTTVRNVRNEIRSAITDRRDATAVAGAAADAVGNKQVRAGGEVRGAISKVVGDVGKVGQTGRPDNIATTPNTVAKSLRDTAKKVVNDVRQAAKDAHQAAKDGPAGVDK